MSALDIFTAPTAPAAPTATGARGLMSGAASAFAALLGAKADGEDLPGAASAEAAPNGQAQLLSGAALFTQAPAPAIAPASSSGAQPAPTASTAAPIPALAGAQPVPSATPVAPPKADPAAVAPGGLSSVPASGAAPAAAAHPIADPTAATTVVATASPIAAAAQAVTEAATPGVSAALAFQYAVAQVRRQAQGMEGERRVERQDHQKAAPSNAAAGPAASAPAASTAAQPSATPAPAAAQTGVGVPAPAPEATPVPAQTAQAATPDPAAAAEAPAGAPDTPTPAVKDAPALGLARATIETTAHLAAQIIRRLDQRSTRFEMGLTPEGLGRVDVSMEIDSDGRLAARLAFDNPIASADLRARADELRRQLEQAGFTLADDALDFTDRQPGSSGQSFGDEPQGRFGRAFARAGRLLDRADEVVMADRLTLTLTPSGVDMKV